MGLVSVYIKPLAILRGRCFFFAILGGIMSSKLAQTIFQTGAKDDLIASDVYKADTGVKNTSSSLGLDSIISSASGALKPSTLSLGTLTGIVSKGASSFTQSDLTSRLVSSIGGNKNAFESLTSGLKANALSELTSAVGIDAKNVSMLVGETKTLINSADLKTATGITGLLSSITGNSTLVKLFDFGSEFAILKAVVIAAVAIGVPLIVDAVLDHIKDDKQKKELLLDTLRQAAIASDLSTVNKAIDYVGPEGVLSRVPDVIEVIITNFKWSSTVTSEQYLDLSNKLINTLDRINTNWDVTKRAGVSVSYLKPFAQASEQAKILFKLHSKYMTPIMIAGNYPAISLPSSIKAKYPLCRITES